MQNRLTWTTVLFAAVLLAWTIPAVFAQSAPNLAGTWRLNFDKSGERVAGNGADVTFPSEMVIAQSPTELTVERTSVRQDPFKAALVLLASRRYGGRVPGDLDRQGQRALGKENRHAGR
jgi:hypothetical protein